MREGHDKLYENFMELKTRTMQNNLHFFGVHEIERNGDTEGLLSEVRTNEITLPPGKRVEDLKFNVVHILGTRNHRLPVETSRWSKIKSVPKR